MQALRANANSLADCRAASVYVLEEIEAAKAHHLKAWQSKEEYYKKKYPHFFDRLGAITKYFGWQIDGFIWGHGEKPLKAILFVALVVLGCSISHSYLEYPANGLDNVPALGAAMAKNLQYYSLSVVGTSEPKLLTAGPFYCLELIIGLVRFLVFGLVISLLFRLLSHR